MQIVTDKVYPDEPCYGLFEGPVKGRWTQYVFVVRGDAMAKFITDLGPEEQFARITPLLIPNFGDDSVSQLQDMAERNRHDTYWKDRGEEMLAESTLIQDAVDQLEKETLAVLNRSVVGPMVRVQRNAFSRATAARQLKERANGKRN